MMTKITVSMVNSENEKISIEYINTGRFKGQRILVITDDDRGNITPPLRSLHLLDEMTINWLLKELSNL